MTQFATGVIALKVLSRFQKALKGNDAFGLVFSTIHAYGRSLSLKMVTTISRQNKELPWKFCISSMIPKQIFQMGPAGNKKLMAISNDNCGQSQTITDLFMKNHIHILILMTPKVYGVEPRKEGANESRRSIIGSLILMLLLGMILGFNALQIMELFLVFRTCCHKITRETSRRKLTRT